MQAGLRRRRNNDDLYSNNRAGSSGKFRKSFKCFWSSHGDDKHHERGPGQGKLFQFAELWIRQIIHWIIRNSIECVERWHAAVAPNFITRLTFARSRKIDWQQEACDWVDEQNRPGSRDLDLFLFLGQGFWAEVSLKIKLPAPKRFLHFTQSTGMSRASQSGRGASISSRIA